ncbi:MAG: hypothetical protein AAFV88_14490 [Planctomycetota bacterium]
MAARDDSVIRGSLITCLIFLVLSLALNFILWSWGDTQAEEKDNKETQLADANNSIRDMTKTNIDMMKMLGGETISADDIEEFGKLQEGSSGDRKFDQIASKFYNDMKVFGQEVGMEDRHYGKLADYFTNIIRDRNEQYGQARDEATRIRSQADSDIQTAQASQQKAETERDQLLKQLEDERATFATYRNDMLQKMESARDSKTKSEREFQLLQRRAGQEKGQLLAKQNQLENTIETQQLELNRLRGGRFESVQGEVRYVLSGGNIVSINLGSADALRPGVTFGVIDRDETARLQDADVKASIQVTKLLGPHLAEARVVAKPEIGNPIINGDAVYSPFWAPGRTVRIALAGPIDLNNDDRPDNQALEGMILAAGAEIADNGEQSGRLDPSVRFLVVGESPDLDDADDALAAAQVAALGAAKQRALEAGVTVIPGWKLEAYLKTIDDSITTPLGSAVRGDDFPARRIGGPAIRRPVDLPKIYTEQRDNVQKGNDIVRP